MMDAKSLHLFGVDGMVLEHENVKYMQMALNKARIAYQRGEAPVGAVIVKDGEVIARAYNKRETLRDPTAHAEVLAIKKASRKLGSWRLNGCDLYVTLEPCPMCAGAIIQSRIANVYFGARDLKAGAVGSVINLFEVERFNHKVRFCGGVLENECSEILTNFFSMLREIKKKY